MEQEVSSFVVEVLRQYGLAGLVMGVMGWVIRALYQDNKFMRNAMFDMGSKYAESTAQSTATYNRLAETLLRGKVT